MDGYSSDRKIIVRTNDLGWPNGITVDLEESRVFYSDAKVSQVYSMNFDGGDRRVVQKYDGHPYAIVVMGPNVYWTDWQNNSIYTTLKTGQSKIRKAWPDLHLSVLDIKFYASSQQPINGTSPCRENNGGCSHLCLLTSRSSTKRTCACPTGVRLRNDKRNCENGAGNMLFIARKVEIQGISLDTSDHTRVSLPLRGVKHAVSVEFDRKEGFLYWADDITKSINRAKLDGTQQQSIINKDLFVPDGIALDSVARNIYFVDSEARRIQVALLNGKYRRTIISEGLIKPRAIAVDSGGGKIYWTDWGIGRVERSYVDGNQRETLIDTEVAWPNGLTLDCVHEKMYWGDAKYHRVEEANMNGSARRILQKDVPHMFGLTLHQGSLYWSEWQLGVLERFDIAEGKREVVLSNIQDMMMLWAGGIRSEVDEKNAEADDSEGNPCHGGGGCSHLCLNTPAGKVCACPDNMTSTEDGKSCVVDRPILLVASRDGRLTQAQLMSNSSLRTATSDTISQVQAVGPIDYYWAEGSVFFVDSIEQSICRTYLERPSRVEAVVKNGLENVVGLAVDWLTGNLYWTDNDSNRLEMSRLNGAYRKVLLWKDMKPAALVVDPLGKQLYWVDSFGEHPRIDRCRLDGSKRTKLVDTKSVARSLSLDPVDKKIYWSDGESIESAELSGKSRRAVLWSAKFRANRLAVHGGTVLLTDGSTDVVSAPVGRPDLAVKVWSEHEGKTIADLKIMHRPSQLGWNHCAMSNGNCGSLCLAAPSKDKPYYCSCPTHYFLSDSEPNVGSCVLPQSVLLFAQKNSISRILLDEDSPDIVLPIEARNVRSLHFDIYSGYIFWLDSRREEIFRSRDDGGNSGSAFKPTNNGSHLESFAMDPLTGQLFWVCSYRNTINIARLMPQGNFKQVGVIVALEKPRLPAVHPQKSLLVFVNQNNNGVSVMSCSFDGTSLKKIFEGDKQMPSDLVVDTIDNLVFWSNPETKTIYSMALDGTFHNTVVTKVDAYALSIYDTKLIVMSRAGQEISIYDKKSGQKQPDFITRRSHLTDVYTPPLDLPQSKPHECPCSHVCLAHGESDVKFACTCPTQYAEGSCDVAQCGSHEWTCHSGGKRCIPLEDRCDIKKDCLDESDELDCCTEVDHFKCSSAADKCIPSKRVCDGHRDCPDGSDEIDCEPQDCKTDGGGTGQGSLENSGSCCPGGFRCQKATGRHVCIRPDKMCDDIDDCADRTDELSCCGTRHFQCHSGSQNCIDASKICDGSQDCLDGSDEFSCCNNTCKAGYLLSQPNEILTSTSDPAGLHWPIIFIGIIAVVVILIVLTLCGKRDTKTPQDMPLHYHVHPPGLSLPSVTGHTIMTGPSIASSATSSDQKTSMYRYDPPPSPATVQSYESSFYHKATARRSVPSSTCSSSQFGGYVGSDASFLGGAMPARRGRNRGRSRFATTSSRGQRPNTPCSTDACEDSDAALYQYNNYNVGIGVEGYVPPPASPEGSLLYSDITSNGHTESRFV
ncbi:low-density lipoprotein receptor-related protein 6-like isoform X2 [Varroa destructor]|nr:low-density lipoprotein receptor-related protein 6-like isoform X2 [Varroa destructor]